MTRRAADWQAKLTAKDNEIRQLKADLWSRFTLCLRGLTP